MLLKCRHSALNVACERRMAGRGLHLLAAEHPHPIHAERTELHTCLQVRKQHIGDSTCL